jgi:hypothetical protein
MNSYKKLEEFKEKELSTKYKAIYAFVVEAISWTAICIKVDIVQTISVLNCYVANFNSKHFEALKWLLEYIQKTLDYTLHYEKSDSKKKLYIYFDAAFADCMNTRRSISDYFIFKGPNLIGWRSHLQSSVSTSTTHAEYVELSETSRELIGTFGKLEKHTKGSTIYVLKGDNQSSIAIATDPKYRHRTKHIEVHYHYVREQVERGLIKLEYVSTKEMLADVLTKPLPKPAHAQITAKLGLAPIGKTHGWKQLLEQLQMRLQVHVLSVLLSVSNSAWFYACSRGSVTASNTRPHWD